MTLRSWQVLLRTQLKTRCYNADIRNLFSHIHLNLLSFAEVTGNTVNQVVTMETWKDMADKMLPQKYTTQNLKHCFWKNKKLAFPAWESCKKIPDFLGTFPNFYMFSTYYIQYLANFRKCLENKMRYVWVRLYQIREFLETQRADFCILVLLSQWSSISISTLILKWHSSRSGKWMALNSTLFQTYGRILRLLNCNDLKNKSSYADWSFEHVSSRNSDFPES